MRAFLPILITIAWMSFAQAQSTNSDSPRQPDIKLTGGGATNTVSGTATNGHKSSSRRLVSEFVGTLAAVDKEKQTVSIASGIPAKAELDKAATLYLTPETKVFKGESPATLTDGVVGQEVRYGIRLHPEDGKTQLTVLRFVSNVK